MKGKLTADTLPAEGGIMTGYHAIVFRSGAKGGGKVTAYISPHAYTSKDDALKDAQKWAEDNAEENE